MNISGKRDPTKLNELKNDGFDSAELYITKEMLDTLDIIELCKNSDVNISSVHTPHIDIGKSKNIEYYKKSDIIANKLDATLILHSNPTSTLLLSRIYPPENVVSNKYGYENIPDVSSYFMKNYLLNQKYPLVLDTAHLHIAEENYLPFIESILTQYDSNMIPTIHLADGTRKNDGIGFGEGTVDLENILKIIDNCDYNGSVVLEAPVDAQPDALSFVKNVLDK
jgi:sugar phosphate isomerase/epimerase